MKLNYTEFSFGYAFTENLIRASSNGPKNAPVFPNLVQEARLGYDVRVDRPGKPIFFQFKLPEYMVRDTAKEIAIYGLRGLSVCFFRMSLMRRDISDQHQLLLDLENRFPDSVFYAAPIIESCTGFNAAYIAANVHLQSALFSPNDIGPLPDNNIHFVSYSARSHRAWFCSDPIEIKMLLFEDLMSRVAVSLSQQSTKTLEGTVDEIRHGVDPLLPDELREVEPQIRERIAARTPTIRDVADVDGRRQAVSVDLLVIRELARIGLGVDFIVAQPR